MPIRFTTTHGELTVALDAMTALAGNRTATPALACMKITVDPQHHVILETFDYTTHVAVNLQASDVVADQKMPSFLVNRGRLNDYIRSLVAGTTKTKQAGLPVIMSILNSHVIIHADGYTFTLPKVDAEYPDMPAKGAGEVVTVDRDLMLATVNRLLVSADKAGTLPVLTGIGVRSVDGGLELATTDRFRLSIAFIPTTQSSDVKTLLPAQELAKIFRYLPAGPVDCQLPPGSEVGLARFTSGVMSIGTKWIDEDFVKYQQLLPTTWTGDVVVPRSELAVAVKRAGNATDRGHHIRMTFADSKVQVTAGGDDGRVTSPAIRTQQTGDDMTGPAAYNPKYLGEALAVFASDAVSIRYTTPARPVLIAEPGELDNPRAFRTLVMPARLPG